MVERQPFVLAIEQICEEKGISKDKVIETIEMAIAAAYKKDFGKRGQEIKAKFDEKTGGAELFQVKEVVEPEDLVTEEGEERELNPDREILLEEAKKIKKGVKKGDLLEFKLETSGDYGRIAAQTAKQVIIQRLREAERESIFDEYKSKEGEVISGVVQRIEQDKIFLDLGKTAGVLFPQEQIPGEQYRVGQRLKVYVLKVEERLKGVGLLLSRAHPEMVRKLFELEVPEIFSGAVEIKAIAREAGSRSKIAVHSKEEGVDPVGAAVGQKGTRVQTVINELNGEKIDIIEWDENIKKFIINALSPANITSVEIKDKKNQEAAVEVAEDQLSLAIGKKGQNVRLAAKLTGWKIDIITEGGKKVKPEEVESKAKEKEKEKDKDKNKKKEPVPTKASEDKKKKEKEEKSPSKENKEKKSEDKTEKPKEEKPKEEKGSEEKKEKDKS